MLSHQITPAANQIEPRFGSLPTEEFFNTSIFHPGLFAHGPLEKLGFEGLFGGLFCVIIIQNHMPIYRLKVLDQTK